MTESLTVEFNEGVPAPKMRRLTLVTCGGGSLQADVPPDFNFVTFVNQARAAGFVMFENLYIPLERLDSVFLTPIEGKPEFKVLTIPPKGAA